jgi:hypothetical protein
VKRKFLALSLIALFMMPMQAAYSATLMHMFIKHEIKAEIQDIADQFVDKDVQKEFKKEYKSYKKEQKRQQKLKEKEQKRQAKLKKKEQKRIEKMHKKKIKRIDSKKKADELKVQQDSVIQAKKLAAQEDFEFKKYNNPPGSQDLDFFGIYGKRQIDSISVVAPDFSKMIYTEIHFYPSLCQLTTELFLVDLPNAKTPMEKVMDAKSYDKKPLKFYAPGMNEVQPQIFRTMTVVDWSADGTKILAKEKIAENLRGFLETRVWVYEVDTQKTYHVQNLRRQIEGYWSQKGLELSQAKWDINPIGWYEPNSGKSSDKLLVSVYGFKPDKTRVFLGEWLVDYKTGDASFITNPNAYPASQNGMVLRPKSIIF